MSVLDQTQDLNGVELYRLSRVHKLPEFVKQASSDDIVGPEGGLEQHCFAHPRGQMYPGHTAAATYISTLFFLDKRAEWDPYAAQVIEASLDKFAAYHGIGERIERLKHDFAANAAGGKAQKLEPDDYALVLGGEGHYPLRNVEEVKAAAVWMRQYRNEMPYDMRQLMATRILEKAAKYGARLDDLDDFLEKQAGHGTCAAQHVAEFLFTRARLYKGAGHVDLAMQFAEMAKGSLLNKAQMHEVETLQKLACVVDQADRQTNMRAVIVDLVPPEDVFFDITAKAASALRTEHLTTTSGNIYRLNDLNAADLESLRSQFGDDFVEAVSAGGLYADPQKMAQVVPTLPLGDAEAFDRLLANMGIRPVAKEAASERGGFDTAELQELAAAHGTFGD